MGKLLFLSWYITSTPLQNFSARLKPTASVCFQEGNVNDPTTRMIDNQEFMVEGYPRELTQNPLRKIWMPCKNGHIAHRRGKMQQVVKCAKDVCRRCDFAHLWIWSRLWSLSFLFCFARLMVRFVLELITLRTAGWDVACSVMLHQAHLVWSIFLLTSHAGSGILNQLSIRLHRSTPYVSLSCRCNTGQLSCNVTRVLGFVSDFLSLSHFSFFYILFYFFAESLSAFPRAVFSFS